ncbi:hypothetical protein C8Q75DRAFT_808204 [Abortiporus biennis]|nr:hypothetical protein C8Q75DRAFT_808204 [Abortiporus biennis]
MATRIFALIIGINNYKSGNIWDLETCVDDANNIKHWLTHDLHVPRDQVKLLLNKQATKLAIEDAIMGHLVNNPDIEKGDAIFIYFAGHGSTIHAPKGWFNDGHRDVEVLCPYDHDTKNPEGRVAGISDRSLAEMLKDLFETKGGNITLMLDCCFTAPSPSFRERRRTRWTPTTKAVPDDLYHGLWRSGISHSDAPNSFRGFARVGSDTHVVLAACRSGEWAFEGKSGGNFTESVISLKDTTPVHSLTYVDLIQRVDVKLQDTQHPVCLGRNKDKMLFDGVPFTPDARYVSYELCDDDSSRLRVDVGEIHGICEGTEFSLHRHNHHGSINPILATYSAVEVHPTWCLARNKSIGHAKCPLSEGWARVTRWNNRAPFRIHVKQSIFNFFRWLRLRRELPNKQPDIMPGKSTMNTLRVRSDSEADVSVKVQKRSVALERHDGVIASNARRIIHLPSDRTLTDIKALDSAAHFHLHLHRKNPQKPLQELVSMELYRLDSSLWIRVSGNLLVDGRAQIVDDGKNSIYAVVLHNHSDTDLYPYLAYMDASGYGISMVYHPTSALSPPPLKKHSHLVIGSGTLDSEALSFTLAEGADTGAGFLKLFLASTFTPMTFIEQGLPASTVFKSAKQWDTGSIDEKAPAELWDSIMACVTVVRKGSY